MSGPKKSYYQIERERRQRLEAERRQNEQLRLSNKISQIKNKLNSYTLVSVSDKDKAINWISEAESHLRNNNEWQADNQLRGVENYFLHLDRVEKRVKEAQIREQQQQDLETKKKIKLAEQIEEFKEFITSLKPLNSKYSFIINRVSEWLNNAKNDFNSGSLDNCGRGLHGITKFLEKDKTNINLDLQEVQERTNLLNQLENILQEKEILTEGIKQRVEMFGKPVRESIASNTIIKEQDMANIKQFLSQVEQIKQDFELKKAEQDFVKSTLMNIVGGSESGGSVVGSINGQSVKISFGENADSKIVFNIDESKGGSCMGAINSINQSLAKEGINLGDILVERTGQKIRLNGSSNQNQDRVLI